MGRWAQLGLEDLLVGWVSLCGPMVWGSFQSLRLQTTEPGLPGLCMTPSSQMLTCGPGPGSNFGVMGEFLKTLDSWSRPLEIKGRSWETVFLTRSLSCSEVQPIRELQA